MGFNLVKSKASKRLEPWPDGAQLLVVDLEATCDARGFPRAERETIEIGAVLVEPVHLEVVKEFQSFVRPVRHPHLTDYCRELTGIEQYDVDAAPSFPQAYQAFVEEMLQDQSSVFVSWGGYDKRQLMRDCRFHGLEYGMPTHRDLSIEFTQRAGLVRRASMKRALQSVGITLEGRHHRGIDDARNLARLLPWCIGRKEIRHTD